MLSTLIACVGVTVVLLLDVIVTIRWKRALDRSVKQPPTVDDLDLATTAQLIMALRRRKTKYILIRLPLEDFGENTDVSMIVEINCIEPEAVVGCCRKAYKVAKEIAREARGEE